MFLVGDRSEHHEKRIRDFLSSEPSIALLLAAVYFEWTICRAVMFLSTTPNNDLRARMAEVYGLPKYKVLWRDEVSSVRDGHLLVDVVTNWYDVTKAFEMRHRLVHGRDRCTRNMATPHVESLIAAAADIRQYCAVLGIDFAQRLPVRRKHK